ncbi:hypothetical protein DICSQDRAFT_77708 [Dichomitus squalens LYAD-421 SS1]|uniref:uncharacterized protein n=1 Tax=Dichomitus squalens (strain LYAD-421) TaxID=732165 RepID=UPI0004413A60|nr:uncharacterized protein DICSQDRAFT_77708 [Dichomitus squalens LYAD-421 SS1]EJF65854.1 hypothetical protein DICSQDRAFT_77708 [Dichomitus squalens LYAD-421 SS1]
MDSQTGDYASLARGQASIIRGHDYFNENSQMVFPSVQSELRSTDRSRSVLPRGMLGMIAPEKRYRYLASGATGPSESRGTATTADLDVGGGNGTQPSDAPSSDGARTQETQLTEQQDDLEETQPSDVAVNGSLTSLFARRRLPPANHGLKAGQSPRMTAKAPEPADESAEPDETGPTEIVSQTPDKTGPTQVVSPSPDKEQEKGRAGQTQVASPSPDTTGPTEIATQSLDKSSPAKFVPDSDPPDPPLRAPAGSRKRPGSASSAATYHSPEVDTRSRRYLQSEDEVLRTIVTAEPSVPPVEEEEEETEEEEEIPLAKAFSSTKAKGKQRAAERESKAPPARSPAATRGRGGIGPQSPVRTAITRNNNQGSSWKGAVVPSSDPGERREEAAPKAAASKSSKPRTPVDQIPPPPPKSRSTRAAKTAAQGRLAESSDEEDQDEDTSSLTDETVPADDDEMDVDPPETKAKPARGNKRKRTVSGSARKTSTLARPNGRPVVKAESLTPLGRPAKRIKTEGGSDSPTRVFALWKGTAQYYSGVVHESLGVGTGRFMVKFDDNDSAELELRHLRACRLKVGDHVLCKQKDKAVVVACSPCPESGYLPKDTVTLELKDDGREEAEVQSLQIPIRSVNAEWDDRKLTEDAVVPVVRRKVSPTPSRRSASASTQSEAQRRKALAGIGLVVSLAPGKEAQEVRAGLVADIKKCGGVVLDDWTCIFGMEGTLEQKGLRWVLKQGDIRWREKAGQGIDKVFLISDDFHQKPKYLVALALGIPCLSVEWLRAYVETEAQWRPYLLPAGYSEQLEARVSQMVDIDWGTSDHHLTDVAANKVASKVFAETSILCISSDYVPAKKAKKSGDAAKDAAESVPRITLCMGAATVESVADAKHASRDPKLYDYVVVPDQNLSKFAKYKNAVDVNWVKDCLISGRLLPMPS